MEASLSFRLRQWKIFYSSIQKFLHQLNFTVYPKKHHIKITYDAIYSPVLRVIKEDNLEEFKKKLSVYKFKVIEIDMSDYKGVYIEDSPDLFGLFIFPKKETISINQSIFNYTKLIKLSNEIQSSAQKNNINNLVILNFELVIFLWIGIKSLMTDMFNISYKRLDLLENENTHKEFIKSYLEFKDNKKEQIYAQGGFSNIDHFSWIYYWEIKIIGKFCKGENISIHDTGTADAQFPLLISGLSENDRMGVNFTRIFASDIDISGKKNIKKIIKKNNNYKPIKFLTLDLTKDISSAPKTDVIIINDVLEHLPNDDISFSALKSLWEKTKKLLIAHLPFEQEPNPIWGHYITFNEKKIRKWAGLLPGAILLSDTYYYSKNKSLNNMGYLIVTKNKNESFIYIEFNNRLRKILDNLDFNINIISDFISTIGKKFSIQGTLNIDNFDSLKECLFSNKFNPIEIDTLHFKCLYFEYSSDIIGLFISLKKKFISLDQNILNELLASYIREEIIEFSNKNNIINLTYLIESSFIIFWENCISIISDVLKIPIEKIFYISFENTHKEYIRNYLNCKNKPDYKISINKNNFIEISSWVYYTEVKIIADLFKNRNISIHCIGSSGSRLPFLLSSLSQENLFGLKISGIISTEKEWNAEEFIKKIINDNPDYKPIEFLLQDFTKNTHTLPASDVMIVNDVLSYLPDNEIFFLILNELLNKAGKLFIAHVFLEDTNITSNYKTKIRNWINNLHDMNILSNKIKDEEECLTDKGYIIIQK